MGDFVKTMRDWKRLCDLMDKKYDYSCCKYCPMDHLKSCGALLELEEDVYADIAETVDAWAAENPEPVYPTWAEWMEEMGLTMRSVTAARRILGTDSSQEATIPFIVTLSLNASNPIPADIAGKLGLKPKGGENDV